MAKQMTNQKHGLVSFLYPFLFFVCVYLFILNFMYDFLDSIVLSVSFTKGASLNT